MVKKGAFSVLGIVLVMTLALLTLTPRVSSQQSTRKPVIIANLACFTGIGAEVNPWMLRAAELACDEFGWKVDGRDIKLVSEDSASDPTIAADKAKKLLEVDKADAFIGPLPASAAFPVAALLKPSGIPHIGILDLMPALLRTGDHVFSHHGTHRGTGYFVGAYAYDVMGYRTATVVHDDVVFAEDYLQGAMDAFVSKGGKIIQRQRTPMNTMDYAPYLSNMKQADCCLFWFTAAHTIQFLSQYSQYGLKMPLVQGGVTNLGQQKVAEMGDKVLNLISCSSYDADVKGPEVKKWVDRWIKLHGSKTEKEGKYPYYAEGCGMYAATSILLQAIQSTKGDTTPSAFRQALRNGKFKTPWGEVSFNSNRVGIGNAYLMKVIKSGNTHTTTDVYRYENVAKEEPESVRDVAPKM
jgi:ABC-type branched-subunit amino acid transport system substrate-binding protein